MTNSGSASTPGASLIPDTTAGFTAAHLAIVAIFALVVIVAIIWGARMKRVRKSAERQIVAHNAEVEAQQSGTPRAEAPVDRTIPPAARPIAEPVAPRLDPVAPTPLADEPIAAAAPLDASPAAEAAFAPMPVTVESSPADAPVSTLKGLGPKLATRLAELGVTTVGQVAALTDDDAARLDAQLGPFAGRITRDRWIEQARFLAAGDRAGFEAVFGRL